MYRMAASSMSLVMLCSGAFFLVAAGLCVFIYLKVPFKKGDPVPPETMLYIAAGIALAGVACCLGAWWRGDIGKRSDDAYLLYPDLLALLQGESCSIVRWQDVHRGC